MKHKIHTHPEHTTHNKRALRKNEYDSKEKTKDKYVEALANT